LLAVCTLLVDFLGDDPFGLTEPLVVRAIETIRRMRSAVTAIWVLAVDHRVPRERLVHTLRIQYVAKDTVTHGEEWSVDRFGCRINVSNAKEAPPRIEKQWGTKKRKKCAARRDVSAEVGSWGARSGP